MWSEWPNVENYHEFSVLLFQTAWGTNTQETSVLCCTVCCEWQTFHPPNCSSDSWHLCVTLQEFPVIPTSGIMWNIKPTWEQSRPARSCSLPLHIASCWHFHFLQSSEQHATWSEKVSPSSCAVLNPPSCVLCDLQHDQPMPIRSNWNRCVKQRYNSHHGESWHIRGANRVETKLQIKRGKIQLRAAFASVPVQVHCGENGFELTVPHSFSFLYNYEILLMYSASSVPPRHDAVLRLHATHVSGTLLWDAWTGSESVKGLHGWRTAFCKDFLRGKKKDAVIDLVASSALLLGQGHRELPICALHTDFWVQFQTCLLPLLFLHAEFPFLC